MSEDFAEFASRVGTDVPVFRECKECGDIVIANPALYDKPKMECDPDQIDACPHWLAMCPCKGNRMIFSYQGLDECDYPDCQNDGDE